MGDVHDGWSLDSKCGEVNIIFGEPFSWDLGLLNKWGLAAHSMLIRKDKIEG